MEIIRWQKVAKVAKSGKKWQKVAKSGKNITIIFIKFINKKIEMKYLNK